MAGFLFLIGRVRRWTSFDKFVGNKFGQRMALAPERVARRGEPHGWGEPSLSRTSDVPLQRRAFSFWEPFAISLCFPDSSRTPFMSSVLAAPALKSSKIPIPDPKGSAEMQNRKAVRRWKCMMGLVGWIVLSGSASASVASSADAPGQHFDLATYKLQTPIARRDSVEEVAQPALRDFVAPFFYYDASAQAMVFNCPDNGATTRGSHFPRSELRDTDEWTFSGQHTLSASLAVTQQPGSGNIIVGQIHGNGPGSEALKIRWSKGDVVVGIKSSPGSTEERFTLVRGLALGDRIDYTIAQSGHTVTVTVNGASKSFTYDHSWDGDSVYFKAGNYLQDNSASGSAGVVKFYALSVH